MTADNKDDKNFMATFGMVLLALVLLTILLIAIGNIVGAVTNTEDQRDLDVLAAKNSSITAPVGLVALKSDSEEEQLSTAEAVTKYCGACHTAGLAGAPKFDDTATWQQRLADAGSLEAIVSNAINGKGGMPPRGGSPLDDAGIEDAVKYMLSEAGVEFDAGTTETEAEPTTDKSVAESTGEALALPTDMDATKLTDGKNIYDSACTVCHSIGAAGAPKLDDMAAWAPRAEQGFDQLVKHAVAGFGSMPPKGGRMDLTDDQVRHAVGYMISEAYQLSSN